MRNSVFLFFLFIAFSGFCQETFSKKYNLESNETKTKLSIGTTWAYETNESFGAGNSIVDYIKLEISDTSRIDGHLAYHFGIDKSPFFYLEDKKMLFYDSDLDSFVMHYNFGSTEDYLIPYVEQHSDKNQIAEVHIDSTNYTFIGRDSIFTQYLSITNSGTLEGDMKVTVYENIGASKSGINLRLGYGWIDHDKSVTDLRCFENTLNSYNFVDYDCDSTWLITNNQDLNITENIAIYPNPGKSNFVLENLQNTSYSLSLYKSSGMLCLSKEIEVHKNSYQLDVGDMNSGIYFLMIKSADSSIFKRMRLIIVR